MKMKGDDEEAGPGGLVSRAGGLNEVACQRARILSFPSFIFPVLRAKTETILVSTFIGDHNLVLHMGKG